MAKRPTINILANTASPTYLTQLNQNFANVQTQFDNTLSLDGSTPNAMNADIDLNGNDLINAGSVNTATLRIGGENVVASAATALAIKKEFETVALLLADTGTYTNYAVDDYLRVVNGGFVYKVAASGASDQHVTTAGGVKLYVLRSLSLYPANAFPSVASSATIAAAGGEISVGGDYTLTSPILMPNGVNLSGIVGPAKLTNTTSTLVSSLHTFSNWAYHQKFERLVLESNSSLSAGSRVQTAFDIKESYYGTIQDSVIRYFSVGANLEGVYPWWFSGVHFEKCDTGIQWDKYAPGSGSANGVSIDRCIFDQCVTGVNAVSIGSADHISNSMFLDCQVGVKLGDTATSYSVRDSYFERASNYAIDAYGSTSFPGDGIFITGNVFTGNKNTQLAAIRARGFSGITLEDNVFSLDDADACLLEIVGDNTEVLWRNNKAIRFLDGTKFDVTQLNLKTNQGIFVADVDLPAAPAQMLTNLDTDSWSKTNAISPDLRLLSFRGRTIRGEHYAATRAGSTPSNTIFFDVSITETGYYTFAALMASPDGSKCAIRLRRSVDFVDEVNRLETLPKEPRLYTATRAFTAGETARLSFTLGDNNLASYSTQITLAPVCFKKSNAILGKLEDELSALERLRASVTTARRPTVGLFVGASFFDTSLGKPIWWNGSVWKDAAGTTV